MRAGVHRSLDLEDNSVLQTVLAASGPTIALHSWQGHDRIVGVATLDPGGTYALLASFIHDDVVQARGTSTGPIEHVVEELVRLIPHAHNGPRHPGPRTPLHFQDVLVLRDLLRTGAQDALERALADLGLTDVPGWLHDLADVTGGVTISIQRPAADPIYVQCAAASTAGWLSISADASEMVHGVPLTRDTIRDTLLDTVVMLLARSPA